MRCASPEALKGLYEVGGGGGAGERGVWLVWGAGVDSRDSHPAPTPGTSFFLFHQGFIIRCCSFCFHEVNNPRRRINVDVVITCT